MNLQTILKNYTAAVKGKEDKSFQEKYKYGQLSDDDLKKFSRVGKPGQKFTFEQCIKNAQTSGSICNPQGDGGSCPYMGFKKFMGKSDEGDCYIGGYENETSKFNGTSGIDVYLTPAIDGNDIVDRTKVSVSKLINKMKTQKQNLDTQIETTQNYLKAIQEGKTYKQVKKEKEIIQRNKEKNSMINEIENTKNKMNRMQEENLLINQLANERGERIDDNNKNIVNNYEKLSGLNKRILNLNQMINSNDYKYLINNKVITFLFIAIFILIVSFIGIMTFYSYKEGNLENIVPNYNIFNKNN